MLWTIVLIIMGVVLPIGIYFFTEGKLDELQNKKKKGTLAIRQSIFLLILFSSVYLLT